MIKSIFITVRTEAGETPNNALLSIEKKPAIEHLIERLKHSKRTESIVLCTTHRREDWVLSNIASNLGILCSQGSVDNMFERWRGATTEFAVDFFVAVEADDLFCEPELIDLAFDQYDRTQADLIEGTGLLTGAFGYGIATPALEKVCSSGKIAAGTDFSAQFKAAGDFKIETLQKVDPVFQRKDLNLSLSDKNNLPVLSKLIAELGPAGRYFSLRDVLKHLDNN